MINKRILLICLPTAEISQIAYYLVPLGLLSIAAYLKNLGYETQVLDTNIVIRKLRDKTESSLKETIRQKIIEFKPLMVGISVMGARQTEMALSAIEISKSINSDIVTVLGGAHASQFPGQLLNNCTALDYVVIGEGEIQASWIVKKHISNDFSAVVPDGIAFRKDKDIHVNPKSKFIMTLDSLPMPAYDQVCLKDYANDTLNWHNPLGFDLKSRIPIMTSRGCPANCNFCSISSHMGNCFRPMSAKRVVDMLEILHEQHDVKVFAVHDANFTRDKKRVLEICNEIIKRRLDIAFDINSGVPLNSIYIEVIHALASVGLIRLGLSIESGDSYIRNEIMGKNFNDDQLFAVIEACREHPEVYLSTDFVMGMPEDTIHSLDKSIKLMEVLDVDEVDVTLATPFPGTKLYLQCVRDNLFFEDINLEEFWRSKEFAWNTNRRFFIKPYKMNYEQLNHYYDLYLKVRAVKFQYYRERMKRIFEVDSQYGLNFNRNWFPFGKRNYIS
ncbi:MAG: B12-binding domain-containing radical SAM protein [Prolixibacteraceae bacterium]|nr:B12-binding domain-containing radical SAM protein [Prolixibacteraceae bacterium]